jgi:hypothetical protein
VGEPVVIVRLTCTQARRVAEIVAVSGVGWADEFAGWMDREMSTASKHRVDVMAPAIAWRGAEEVMFDWCFDARGFRRKVSSVDLRAHKEIRRALNGRENHPALYGRAAIGLIPELIPAWRFPGPDASGKNYAPYPVTAMPFVVLAPEMRQANGQRITMWVEAPRPHERPLLAERSHTAFC